ncbi:hypothetical protein WBQ28_17380 [Pseudomonas syringae pv. syringae]|uniref:hypothetical protein n=1 Tax=Pseudomonas syringae TaxID=317 RepID=UPI003B00DCAA
MLSRIISALSLLTILAATSAAAQQLATEQLPHIPVMSHQTMTYNGKIIYEADVDQNAPNPRPFALQLRVDTYSGSCTSIVGHVSAAASKSNRAKGAASSEYISCVVTELSPDGNAKADIVYDFKDEKNNVYKSGHVKASLQAGKEYKTESNGSQVTILMHTY